MISLNFKKGLSSMRNQILVLFVVLTLSVICCGQANMGVSGNPDDKMHAPESYGHDSICF